MDPQASNLMSERFNPAYVGARPDLAALVPDGWRTLLDVGCANGALGAALQVQNPGGRVTGIELDTDMAEEARTRLDRVEIGDVREALARLADEGLRFDVIICGDVLEHLVDPWQALLGLRERLSEGGSIIVSLPNVAHLSVFWALFQRSWQYQERGIFDRTHLRFFAERDIRQLVDDAELRIAEQRINHRITDRPLGINEKLAPVLRWVPLLNRYTAYQFLLRLEAL